jgi:hypothetical protein
VFFDSTIEGGTDPLIDFHNKLNQNLFQKKNLKILKRFYESEPILTDRKAPAKDEKKPILDQNSKNQHYEDPFEEANKKYEQKRAEKGGPLNDEKTDYILEQRATAITTMTARLHGIATRFPLSKHLAVSKPNFRVVRKPTRPVEPRWAERREPDRRQQTQHNFSRTLDGQNPIENLSLTGRFGQMQAQALHTTKSSIHVNNQSRRERTGNSNLGVVQCYEAQQQQPTWVRT